MKLLVLSPMKFNLHKLLFSKSAAARILGCSVQRVKRLEVWATVIFVVVEGRKPTFISPKAFKRDFAEFRHRGAQTLEHSITPHLYNPQKFTVRSLTQPDHYFYIVSTENGGVECTCADFRQQREVFGDHPKACKHTLAVLRFHLGFESLAAYLQDRASSYRPGQPAAA